jgi:LEA14-like dessication related protein
MTTSSSNHPIKSFVRVCALAVLLGALGGCGSLGPKVEAPRLTLVSVAMNSADMFSQQFTARMHVQNPNDRPLPIKGIDYQLFLAGDSFAEGVSGVPFVVPALGETEFDLPVRTNFISSLGRLVSRLNGKDTVDYLIEGKVFLESGMVRKIPFRASGEVNLALKK